MTLRETEDADSDALNELMELALRGLRTRLLVCVDLLDRNQPEEARELLVAQIKLLGGSNDTIQ